MKRTTPPTRWLSRGLGLLVLAGLGGAACSNDSATTASTIPASPRVVVTSVAGDDESALLAAIYARVLEDAGFRVSRRDPVTLDRAGYIAEVEAGSIDLIPEWSGALLDYLTALPNAAAPPTTVMPPSPASTVAPVTLPTTTTIAPTTTTTTPASTMSGTGTTSTSTTSTTTSSTTTTVPPTTSTVPDESTTTTTIFVTGRAMLDQMGALRTILPATLVVSSGALAQDVDVIACTSDTMDAHAGVEFSTYTNLASNAPSIRLGASDAWLSDEQVGLPAFTLFYGGEFAETVPVTDRATAIDAGDADCFVLNSLDPLITQKQLTILTDDLSMTPANGAIALLSTEAGTPDLGAAIDAIANSLTSERLNQMLNQVAQGTDPLVVANAFVDTL